jgi:hypothetical protein
MERMTLKSIVLHPFCCGFSARVSLAVASLAFALATSQIALAQTPLENAPSQDKVRSSNFQPQSALRDQASTSSQVPWQVQPATALSGPTRLSPMVPLRHQQNASSQFKLQQMQPQLKLQRLPSVAAPIAGPITLSPTRLAPLPKVGSAPQTRRNLDWRSPLAPRQKVYYQAQAQPDAQPGVVQRAPMQSNNNQVEGLDLPVESIATLLPRAIIARTHDDGIPANLAIDEMKFSPINDSELSSRNAIRTSGREVAAMWGGSSYTWVAPNFSHQPLYFEQANLERYGHHHGIYQPAISGAHFFSSVAILPYKVGAYRPCEEIYTLGHYRPGDCNPHQFNWLPWSWRGALYQGAAVSGISFIP